MHQENGKYFNSRSAKKHITVEKSNSGLWKGQPQRKIGGIKVTKVALAVKRDTRHLKLKIINSNTSAAYGEED
jgi:hypothetical protein